MLTVKCVIENLPTGELSWYAKLVDEPHTYARVGVTAPQRPVPLGRWRPPRQTYTTVRGAVASIHRLARHLRAQVAAIDLVEIEWGFGIDHKPQRKYVARRPLR